MKEEKENQKTKEEKVNLKETKEKKVSKKAVKAKEATDEKVVKKAPAKKDTTKEKKIVSKAKVKAEKEDIAEVVAEVKEEKKTTKKATTKTAKEKAASDEKEPKKTTAKEKISTSKKKVEEDVSEVEVKEEEATVVVSNNDATEEADEAKVEPVEESKKTKENNAKLEASIAKLKGKKVAEKSEAKDSKPDTDLDEGEEIIIDAPKTDSESQKRKEKIEEQAELLEKKKKRKSSIITTSIIAALIVIIVIVIIIIGSLNSTTVESHDFYQWYSGQRVEYKGELTFTRKEGLTELKATDRKVTLDSTPVYYADENGKVIFPEDMAVVYPNNNGMMYRINHFADITEENGEIYLETNLATKTNKTKLEKAFLYDGQDLYFFLERTNITVNGTTYEVSPLSYAIVRYKQSVEIYNYEKDEYQVIDTTETQDAKVVTDTYTINMSVDSLQTAEKEQLLIKGLSYLQPFGEEAEK
ncbi:MAG: hypothetical protein ACLUG5_06615 [Clostridia bacterium]